METFKTYQKPIIITSLSIVGVLAAIFVGLLVRNSVYSSYLEVNEVFPEDAVILLDGNSIGRGSGKLHRITPGEHTVAVVSDGWFPDGQVFSVEAEETFDFSANLEPYSDAAVQEFEAQ